MPNANFDTLLSTTLNNHRPRLTDNVFKDRVLSWFLLDKKRSRMDDGGVKIVEPLLYAAGQAGSYSGWDQINITPQTGVTAAEYPWKQLYATVAISGLEKAQNSGENQVLNLVKTKVEQAEETLKNNINTMLWGNGTGNSGKDWGGIAQAISNTGVYGGIDAAVDTWWRSHYVDVSGDAGVTAKTVTLEKLFSAINKSANGSDKVDGLFTNVDIYGEIEGLFQPQVQYQDVKAANAGFENLTVKGIPLYFDQAAPAERIFGINSKYLTVVGHKDVWFKSTGDDSTPAHSAHATSGAGIAVDGTYRLILTYGNLTCRNRARHFLMDWIDIAGTA